MSLVSLLYRICVFVHTMTTQTGALQWLQPQHDSHTRTRVKNKLRKYWKIVWFVDEF